MSDAFRTRVRAALNFLQLKEEEEESSTSVWCFLERASELISLSAVA